MSVSRRLKPALKAASKHLMLSVLVVLMSAALVFGLWFPSPYEELAGGGTLFGLVVIVDVICGPLLTLVIFNELKPRRELVRDIAVIIALQLLALGYGLYSVMQARPIFLTYEGNRFRVVSAADIDTGDLHKALPIFQSLSYSGPRLVGARLLDETDPRYQESIFQSLEGSPPSFHPERWVPYESVQQQLQAALLPISTLKSKVPNAVPFIDQEFIKNKLSDSEMGYLPLEAEKAKSPDWIVVVERKTGMPKLFLPLNGW